ncbi:MAG: HAMP domain-containing protein [Spirochaetales bacterium]|jgi:nitrogen fixation/metabolism regulation signal transduction histidine kinase|nr:HAMP domain-containing protein [Spirochaetales bacterium]
MKMRWKHGQSGSPVVLLGLFFFYVLFVSLVLFFSNQVLQDFALNRNITLFVIGGLTILFSSLLLFTIGFQGFQLFRAGSAEKPGMRFKLRLVFFFLVIIVFAAVPQAVLSVNFINSALRSVFNSRVDSALRDGLSVAMQYYNEKAEFMEQISSNSFFSNLLQDSDRNGEAAWENLKQVLPYLASFQVFSQTGDEVYETGDRDFFAASEDVLAAAGGLLPREILKQNINVLRSKKEFENRRGRFFVVLSARLPETFDQYAENLTSTLETYRQFEQYRPAFLFVISTLYGLFSFPLMLLAILASFRLSDEIVRPLVNLEDATRKVAEGDFSFRILSRSRDELSLLADSFNRMVMELEKSRLKSMQTEKVAAWQEIAQRLAHEIKNPLTPIKLSAQRILKRYGEKTEDFGEVLYAAAGAIIREVDGLDALLTEFRNFSRLPAPQPQPVKLKDLILEATAAYRYRAENISIHCDEVSPAITLSLDPGQIRQVFANLVTNGIDAMPRGGDIIFRADIIKKGNTRYCRIQVEDTGEGIAAENVAQVFNPYFTTKSFGTGLGLSVVERIIFDHKGQIWFESHPGVGTTFFIDLPAEKQDEQGTGNR